MRKICYSLLALVILLLSGCMSVSSQNSEPHRYQTYKEIPGVTQEDIDAVENLLAKKPRLVYGFCASTEAFLREDGSVGGFAELFGNRLTELFGFEFDYYPCSWEEMNEKIVAKEIDLVSDFTATPERLQKFLMSDAIIQRTVKVFTNMNADSLSVTAKSRPIRCAFMDGSTTYSFVADSWNMPFDPVFIADQSVVPDMFSNGQIDAFIEEGTLEAAFDAYDFIQTEEYYPLTYSPISLTTGNPEMAPIINVIQKYLKDGGYYELTELYNQGYEDYLRNKLSKQLTEEEKEYLQKHVEAGTAILVACEVDNYPTSFYNTQEQEFQGMALDTLEQISHLTGLTFRVGNEPDALWPELIGGLENGKYSIVSELLRSSQREGRYLWADRPYSTNNYALLSSADYPDLDINQVLFAEVGLMEGAAHTDIFLEWFPDSAGTAKYYVSNDDAFAALVKGEIDLLMASQNMLLNLTNYQEKPGFKANIVFNYSSDSFFGFNKDEEILCSIVNKAMRFSNGEEISARWQRKVFDYESKMLKDVFPFAIILVGLLIAVLVVVFVLFMKNRQMNKNLEGLVANRTKELEMQTLRAENASRAKGDFLSRMSHEIRTPLNAITGMVGIARSTTDPDRVSYCLNRVDGASKHLLGIINDILDMSKIEADKFELDYREFDFEKMLMSVVNVTNFRAEEKKQNFIVNLDRDIPASIVGDDLRLSQVITNLLSNAVKFTPEGGTVKLNIHKTQDMDDEIFLLIEVVDNGIGISEEQQGRIFNSFEQADGGIARKFGGTGLGLVISKRIVELMGGRIWVESEPGQGSKFNFTLKARKGSGKDRAHSELSKKIRRDELRILAVDDSPDIRDYFIHVMESLSLSCDVAHGGHQALAMVRDSGDKPYNVFFIDWQMPEMDGIELTKKVKEITAGNSVVFMISVAEWSGIEKEALAAGVKSFVSKPLFPSTLINAINECLAPEPRRSDEGTPGSESGGQRSYANRTILIAEDVEINREIMSAVLEDTDITIDYAENGLIAVSMFRENHDKYSLIFMDIHMPDMDGYEATRTIRSLNLARAKDIPIVAMTANVFKEDIENCLKAGMNDHIGKPIDPDNLFKKLDQYLPEITSSETVVD